VLNALNVDGRAFPQLWQTVLPKLWEQQIGVLGMKIMGDHIISEERRGQGNECLPLRG